MSERDFVRAYAKQLRANDPPPAGAADWAKRAKLLRAKLREAVGPEPTVDCSLAVQTLGEVRRPGFVIEKLIFQTRPDVWATANFYRPEPAVGKGPAVLVVHGHWRLARVDPVVQSRCLGLVKLGFSVLCLDAFGAGERYSYPAPGTYHGAAYGAPLWPVGQSLLGVQLHDNRRAVDYLSARPEVDPNRIGITGASGGGNQSMYAGAMDERLKCVAPVCSVGNYQAYLLAACCLCEVVPGALQFTEEGDVLGLIAPRALLVVNAGKDSVQFSPAEAAKSLERTRIIYHQLAADERLKHAVFDAGHGYDAAMREVMYGWMTRWLKNEGKGEPIPEPKFSVEEPDALRCYPDPDERPKTWLYPPTLAKRIGMATIAKQFSPPPSHREEWESTAVFLRQELKKVLGPTPKPPRVSAQLAAQWATLTPEPGLPMDVSIAATAIGSPPAACVVIDLAGSQAARATPMAKAMIAAGFSVFAPDLRFTKLTKEDAVRTCVDHNPAEHGVWIGRPLLGQWVFEVQVLLDWLSVGLIDRKKIFVAGVGSGGIVALAVAALEPDRVAGCVVANMPATYLTDVAYGDVFRLGVVVPGMFRAGDVPHLAAAVAPRRLVVADAVDPQGAKLPPSKLRETFAFTTKVYEIERAATKLTVTTAPEWGDLAAKMAR